MRPTIPSDYGPLVRPGQHSKWEVAWQLCADNVGREYTLFGGTDYDYREHRNPAQSARLWARRRGMKATTRYNSRDDLLMVTFHRGSHSPSASSKWYRAGANSGVWVPCKALERPRAEKAAAALGMRVEFKGQRCRFLPDLDSPSPVGEPR